MIEIFRRLRSRPAASAPAQREVVSPARDERLRAAFAAAPVGLGVASFEGKWLLFNDTAAALLGYTREELSRLSLHEITHEEDLPREMSYIRRMAEGEGQRYQIEKRVIDKLGNARELTVTAALMRGRNGTTDAIVYVIEPPQPRTESGRTADGLSNAILDSLPETAVIRCDAQGMILGWNRGAEAMFGYPREEVIGRNRRILYRPGEEWTEAAGEHLRIAAERHRYEAELDKRVARDGREIPVRVSIITFAPEGAVRGFVEVMHAPSSIPIDEVVVTQLREQLRIERESGLTLTSIIEKLKARVQTEAARAAELEQELIALRERVKRQESAEWTPLAERNPLDVLAEAARHRRSGLLLFVSGARQKSIHLEEGRIASCASSDIEDSFGEQLVRRGAITEAQRTKALEMANTTNIAFGRAVVILGAMREEDVVRALHEKIDRELVDLQAWTEGRWTFVNRQPPRVKPVRVSLALDELRQFARPEFVASRNGTRYHRENCTVLLRVKGSERTPVVSALAGAQQGLSACRLCVTGA